MKKILIIVFSILSFVVSAQEKKNTDSQKGAKSPKKVITISNSDNNKSKASNSQIAKEKNPDKTKISPDEFYIINDKPVDKLTYLKNLKTNKK
jgi:hypothetical protein